MLNKEQKKSVEHINGPFLCIAGPGSGKTFTLTNRVKALIDKGVNPYNILVLTFSKAAASEMETRYLKIDNAVIGPLFSTIHSFALKLIISETTYTYDSICDETKSDYCIKKYLKDAYPYVKDLSYMMLQSLIRNIKNDLSSIMECEYEKRDMKEVVIRNKEFTLEDMLGIYEYYKNYKKQQALIDFDDMLYICNTLLQNEDIHTRWANQFTHIMIDEFQDTSKIQASIIYRLAYPNNNLFIVGDDDQSIYGFRNARPEIMLNFKDKFKDTQISHLTINYRSDKKIVKSAKKLIEHNSKRFPKDLMSKSNNLGNIKTYGFKDSYGQEKYITDYIAKHCTKKEDYVNYAILCRTNKEVNSFAKMFTVLDIPFHTSDPLCDIYDTWVVKTIFAYARIITGKYTNADTGYIINRPKRYVKNQYINQTCGNLEDIITIMENNEPYWKCKSILELRNTLIDLQGMFQEEQWNPYELFYTIIKEFEIDEFIKDHSKECFIDPDYYIYVKEQILEECLPYTNLDDYFEYVHNIIAKFLENKHNDNDTGVCLSTMHRAKGLEWDYVFVPSCNNKNIPFGIDNEDYKTMEIVSQKKKKRKRKAQKKEDDEMSLQLSEERRLLYVAITRARHKCILLYIDNDKSSLLSELVI